MCVSGMYIRSAVCPCMVAWVCECVYERVCVSKYVHVHVGACINGENSPKHVWRVFSPFEIELLILHNLYILHHTMFSTTENHPFRNSWTVKCTPRITWNCQASPFAALLVMSASPAQRSLPRIRSLAPLAKSSAQQMSMDARATCKCHEQLRSSALNWNGPLTDILDLFDTVQYLRIWKFRHVTQTKTSLESS